MTTARQRHQAVLLPHNSQVLIVGGTNGGNAVASAEVYVEWQGDGGTFFPANVPTNATDHRAHPNGARVVNGGGTQLRAWSDDSIRSERRVDVADRRESVVERQRSDHEQRAVRLCDGEDGQGRLSPRSDRHDHRQRMAAWGARFAYACREPAPRRSYARPGYADGAGNIISTEFIPDIRRGRQVLPDGSRKSVTGADDFTDASFTASVSGNWTNPATWGNVGSDPGTPGSNIPGANDAVTISSTGNVTVTVNTNNAAALQVTIGTNVNGSAATLQFNNGAQLTVGSDVSIGGTGNRTGNLLMTSGGTLKVGGALTYNSNGAVSFAGGTIEYNGSGAQTILSNFTYGNLTISGSRGASVTIPPAGNVIQILGTFTPSATFSSGGYITTGSTINIGGAGSQTVPSVPGLTYNNLTISGSGTKTSNGNVSLTGNLNVLGSTVFDWRHLRRTATWPAERLRLPTAQH